jgi:hypothetical protein
MAVSEVKVKVIYPRVSLPISVLWLCVLFFRLLLFPDIAANARARGRHVYPRAWAFSACSRYFSPAPLTPFVSALLLSYPRYKC